MSSKPPLDKQADYWDRWNLKTRTSKIPSSSVRQGEELVAAVATLGRRDLQILDLGCGTGWAGALLRPYGRVTGTDMVTQSIELARSRYPDIAFHCGNLFEVTLPESHFDVVISLEVLAHVGDQPAFFERVACLLKPGGLLLLCTQNRRVYSRWSTVAPPDPGQLRHWVDAAELRGLLAPRFRLTSLRTLSPEGDMGLLRLTNSVKLNRIANAIAGETRIERLKEALMLGRTLYAIAHRL